MPCIRGCNAADHLHNIPNRPPTPTTLSNNFQTSDFTEVLKSRLQTVLDESEPSKRIIWKRKHGGDAQDTVDPSHKGADLSTLSDDNQFCGDLTSRPLTPNCKEIEKSQMRQEKLTRHWRGDSGSTGSALQRPGLTDKEACQTSPTHSVAAMQPSSFLPSDAVIDALAPNAFNLPASGSSMKLASPDTPLQFDHGHNTSHTPPLDTRDEDPETKSSDNCSQQHHPDVQASYDVIKTENAYHASAECKSEATDTEDEEHFASPAASILGGCLCGCGGDAMHCLRPNKLPTPNTFWENWWGPHFGSMLLTRLDSVARDLEPSRRIWWRETFGGCAPDREPLVSEQWAWRGGNWGTVLKTSPPPYPSDDDILKIINNTGRLFLPRRPRAHSTTSLDTPDHSLEDAANAPSQFYTYKYINTSKSLPIYEKDKGSNEQSKNHWANLASHHYFTQIMTPRPKTKPLENLTHHHPREKLFSKLPGNSHSNPYSMRDLPVEAESGVVQQSLAAVGPRRYPRRGINFDRCRNLAGKSAIFIFHNLF